MRIGKREASSLLALCIAVVLASFPAWTGSWIYDDWLMHENPKMDGVEDLLAVFGRSSADYLGSSASSHVGAVTYRPLSVLSLIAVQLLAPESTLAHHALSLLMHLATMLLLYATLRVATGTRLAMLAAVVFGLHPLGVEAYGWINGRSDVLAGLGVALVGWALWGARSPQRFVLAGLGSLLAVLAKETALVAVLGLALASLVPSSQAAPEPRSGSSRWAPAMACLAALLSGLAARAWVLGDAGKTIASVSALPDVLRSLVRLFSLSLTALLVPVPRTMRNLAYELAQPLDFAEILLLTLACTLLGFLVWRRNLRALVLVLSAAAMIAPCVLLRHAFWLGCDRYLYMPLLLLCLALGGTELNARLDALPRIAPLAAGVCGLLVLCASTFLTAQTYHDQSAHMLAMIRMRPEDPTGYLVGARWLMTHGNRAGAAQLLSRIERAALAAPLASRLATLLGDLGLTREALELVADLDRRYPDDPYAQLDVLAVSFDQGEIVKAAQTAERLRSLPPFCRAARALLDGYLAKPTTSDPQRAAARAQFAGYSCP